MGGNVHIATTRPSYGVITLYPPSISAPSLPWPVSSLDGKRNRRQMGEAALPDANVPGSEASDELAEIVYRKRVV